MHTNPPWKQFILGGLEGCFLAEAKQGGHQRVTLLPIFCLGDSVGGFFLHRAKRIVTVEHTRVGQTGGFGAPGRWSAGPQTCCAEKWYRRPRCHRWRGWCWWDARRWSHSKRERWPLCSPGLAVQTGAGCTLLRNAGRWLWAPPA